MPDAPETRKDSSKDESGSLDPKEEALQQEIEASTADEQVSIKSIPDASISLDTQTPDERQTKARPSEHNEEIQ
jgi:hypothetical protein